MRWSLLLVLAACGRIGFEETGAGGPLPPIVGELDPTFGDGGVAMPSSGHDSEGWDIALRGTGYLVMATNRTQAGVAQMNVIALAEDGTLDPAYGPGGELFLDSVNGAFGYGVTMLPDGSAIILGDGDVPGERDNFLLGKLTPTGTLAPSWGGGTFVNYNIPPTSTGDTAWSAVHVGTTTYFCGLADYSGDPRMAFVATRDDGSLETAFGTGGILSINGAGGDECTDIAFDGSTLVLTGRIADSIVIGTVTLPPAVQSIRATGLPGRGRGLALQPDGARVVAAELGSTGGALLRFFDTSRDPSFGQDGIVMLPEDVLAAVQIDGQGRIVVAGSRGPATPLIRRFLADGTPDLEFADGGAFTMPLNGRFVALAIDGRGRIVAVGSTETGLDRPLVVRLH